MDENTGSFGYWIKRRRKALDLTRAGLAVRVSCSSDTIKKIERDERRPSLQIASLLADALELAPEERAQFLSTAEQKRSAESLPFSAKTFLQFPRLAHPLPSQTTPFIGRQTELAELTTRLCDPGCRLLTLVGPGGMGKTRLALQAAEHLQTDYRDGACFTALAGIDSPGDIPSAISTSLGLNQFGKFSSKEQLIRFLQNKELLLLLDNYEHLLPETGLLADILQHALGVKLLVTSRQRLNLISEWVYAIEGLSIPVNGVSDLETYSSAALFVGTARRLKPDFTLDESNKSAVAQICRQVEGMPLAIELAAAWIPALEPQEIARQLESGLDLLEADFGDLPERQRSMRAVFDVSWKLLTLEENQAIQKLAVFRGGFNLISSEAAFEISQKDILRLVNKCWVQPETGGRFHLHELVRQYALEKLRQDPDLSTRVEEKHSAYFCHFLKVNEDKWWGPDENKLISEIESDLQNIEAAWNWALAHRQTELIANALNYLARIYSWSNRTSKLRTILLSALDYFHQDFSQDGIDPRIPLLAHFWTLTWFEDNWEKTSEEPQLIQEAAGLLARLEEEGCDTRNERAHLLLWEGDVKAWSDPQAAMQLHRRSAALYAELGDKKLEALALYRMAELCRAVGILDQGLSIALKNLAFQKEVGNHRMVARNLELLAKIYRETGEVEEAEKRNLQSMQAIEKSGFRHNYGAGLIGYTITLICAGKFEEARRYAQESIKVFDWMGEGRKTGSLTYYGLTVAELHLGEYAQAKAAVEFCVESCKQTSNLIMLSMILNHLGEIYLVEKNITEALECLQESHAIIQNYRHYLGSSMPLINLGCVYLTFKQPDQANQWLVKGLQEASRKGSFRLALHGLLSLALLEGACGRPERAIEIYTLAMKYPYVANSKWFRAVFGVQIDALAEKLPPETVSAARSRGRKLELWEVVKNWLQEKQLNR
jgi:predicted ATPase/transcriptional regulator with XRE-family HTH domain